MKSDEMNQWEKIKSSMESLKIEDLKGEVVSFIQEIQKLASISSLSPEVKKCFKNVSR